MSARSARSGGSSADGPLIAVLPGDGIGPEVVEQGLVVLAAVGERFGWRYRTETAPVGGAAIDGSGNPLPPETLRLAKRAEAVYFGAVGGPKWDDPRAPVRPEGGILALRKGLGLYANLRPVKLYPALLQQSVLKEEVLRGTDLIVVRELTGGLYFGKPSRRWETSRGWRAVDTLAYSEGEIERVLRAGFELARRRRKKLTSVDKANVLTTGRFWREIATRVGREEYPDVELEHILVDSAAMYLMRRPASFDVMVTENMFGDILSDLAGEVAGSLGIAPSLNSSDKHAMAQAAHGSAPDIAGQNKANPTAMILSSSMLLRWMGERNSDETLMKAADIIDAAVELSVSDGTVTPDMGGTTTTSGFADAVVAAIARV